MFEAFCLLCREPGVPFYKDKYWLCTQCHGIFMAEKDLLPPTEEKERYLKHQNNREDVGYRQFVSPIVKAVVSDYNEWHVGLDFGAGHEPMVALLLREKQFKVAAYDPFFFADESLLGNTYDYITCCEVMEHFYEPLKEFSKLYDLLKPGGSLFCMTHLYSPEIDFDKWYYKNDKTHVFIYQESTLHWIKEQVGFADLRVENRLIVFRK